MKIIFILTFFLVFSMGCRHNTEPIYSDDGKLYLNGIPYSGPITVLYNSGKEWTELKYIDGVPEEYLVEWDEKGNIAGKKKIDPKDIEYQWEQHRRHLPKE